MRVKRFVAVVAVVALLGGGMTTAVTAAVSGEIKLTASDAASRDNFGFSVAISGDVIVVGAREDDDNGAASGSAYVYTSDGDGGYEEAKLTASDGASGDWFGRAVAVSGDTVVVGALRHRGASSLSGAAYVYTPDGVGGYDETKLTASDAAFGDRFGRSVAISGTTIVVGATTEDTVGIDSGAAYVYTPDGVGGYDETKLTASDSAAGDNFGVSVAISGTTIVVGAHSDDDGGVSSGSAYVYTPDGVGGYDETKLTASDAAASDRFGWSVGVAGDIVAVGADRGDGVGVDSGLAYVYTPDGVGGYDEVKLTASDAAAGDNFGWSIAIAGTTVVVGAKFDQDAGAASGSAYVYESDGAGGYTETKATASDEAAGDQYGYAVAIDGSTLVISAPFDDDSASGTGSAYVYTSASGPLCNGQTVTVDLGAGDTPTAGDDVILGTAGPDVINALGGNDVVCAEGGDDTVLGGAGNDLILGGSGADLLSGNAGDDTLVAEGGPDRAFGGSGNDFIFGGLGNDVLGGGSDSDSVSGEAGNDAISGGSGNDGLISGGSGNDAVNGGGNNDNQVNGDDGDDTVSGNGGKDTVNGGAGDDQVRGGQNDDLVNGGPGDDFVAGNGGIDVCDGGTTGETAGDTAASNCETIVNVP